MRNYDLEPLIIEDSSNKLNKVVLYVTFGVLIVGCIVVIYLKNHFPVKNKTGSSFWAIMIANFVGIMVTWAKEYFLPGQKSKNSYFYFENHQIVQRNENNVIKTINIKDIKILRKSFKHPDFFPINIDTDKDYYSFISKVLVVFSVFLACLFIVPDYFMYIVMFVAILAIVVFFIPLAIVRSFNGLKLNILENYVLIQTDDDRIILLNLTKGEFDKLEKYFKSLGKDII